MFRNKVINGSFDVWQRATSQTSDGYGSDDRWLNSNAGSTKTASRQTFTLGQTDVSGNPKYWARTVVTSVAGANNYCHKRQSVEGVSTLAGQTVTLSFWAKADASKNIAVEFKQAFGTGGSPSADVNGASVTTVALTTSWVRYTVTAALPSVTGKTLGTNNDDSLQVVFWFDAGSTFNSRTNSLGQQSGTFDIANVQLEAGSQASPFEQRPVGLELALCQRYYWQTNINGRNNCGFFSTHLNNSAVQVNRGRLPYPVVMRASPNFTYTLVYGDGAYASSTLTANNGYQNPIRTESIDLETSAIIWNASGNAGTVNYAVFLNAEL